MRTALAGLGVMILSIVLTRSMSLAFDWVPTDEEMATYRQSWNPPMHGASLTGSADLTRQGQWMIRAYTQGQIGSGQFENNQSSKTTALPFSPNAVMPATTLYYGLTRHVMAGVGVSGIYWHSNNADADGHKSGSGIRTTRVVLKYRPIVQDPGSWRPSISLYSKLSTPTNRWDGTPKIPGAEAQPPSANRA